MSGTRRPWKVFVRDVGPPSSFATEERAHARAKALLSDYAEVLVYSVEPTVGPRCRTVYRFDRPARVETFVAGVWQ